MLRRWIVFSLLFIASRCSYTQEQEPIPFDILEHSIHLPHTFKDWRYKQALGFSLSYLPKDWLESAVSLPMLYYKSNFSIKKGFAINSDIRCILVANEVAIGPSWNRRLNDKLFVGVGYQLSYGLGILYDLGYDNSLNVIGHKPYVKLGYLCKDLTFTFKGGVDFTNKLYFEAGATALAGNLESLNGYNFSLFVEQRMFKNKSFSIGYTSNFLKFHILGWPAFTYTKEMYYIPELTTLFNF